MKAIALIQIAIGLAALLIVGFYVFRHFFPNKRDRGPKKMEPDLGLVTRPDLIGRIPGNEEEIPDANSTLKKNKREAS